MDSDISTLVKEKKRRFNLRLLFAALIVLAAGAWGLRQVLGASVRASEIRIAAVENGPVENTLTATGLVAPEFEQLISSPLHAVIQSVSLSEGAPLKVGDLILTLDKETAGNDFEKQRNQLLLKQNAIERLRLDLEKSYFDLKINDSIKQYRIEAIRADLENAKRLFRAGGGTRESIEKIENDLKIARLEKRQLENDLSTRQAVMKADLRESELSAAIQQKDLDELQRKLQKADIQATHAGVLTWVNKSVGSKVAEGEALARLADLSGYKVTASISDRYAERLAVDMPVLVRINDEVLQGRLTNIHPSVANNVVTFEVGLQDKSNAALRPSMKVEVYIVTESRANAVRVVNGPAFKGGAEQDVFVLRADGKAERRRVVVGLSNFNYVEIVSGVMPGEQVIISDLSSYRHVRELSITQ